jgi:hypothetical protein
MAASPPPTTTIGVMLDLETIGTNSRAPIVSLAAVVFDKVDGVLEEVPPFYAKVNVECYDDLKDKFELDYSTLKWWTKQPNAASTFDGTNALGDALGNFVSWWRRRVPRSAEVWCQGADFDFPILKNAFKAFKMEAPWFFSVQRDTRTLYSLVGRKTLRQPETTHDALQDCRDQVDMVCQVFNRVEFTKEDTERA